MTTRSRGAFVGDKVCYEPDANQERIYRLQLEVHNHFRLGCEKKGRVDSVPGNLVPHQARTIWLSDSSTFHGPDAGRSGLHRLADSLRQYHLPPAGVPEEGMHPVNLTKPLLNWPMPCLGDMKAGAVGAGQHNALIMMPSDNTYA